MLFIFDRFDMYADDKLLKFVNTKPNVALLISRRGYKEIKVTFDDVFELEYRTDNNGVVYLTTKPVF